MLKSILTSAFRNIVKNRSFSAINLIGLSVSMSLGLLIITLVQEAFTYDDFHKDPDRIYRVNTRALRKEGGSEQYASVPLPIGHVLSEYTFAEDVVRLVRRLNGDASHGSVNVPVRGMFADPGFFKLFGFTLSKGDPATALVEPNSLVLTQAAAQKLFGDRDPLGQTLTISGYGEFQVTGVFNAFPGKTHLEFEVLGSMTILPLLEKAGTIGRITDNWNNYYSSYVYFRLKDGFEQEDVDASLMAATPKYYANLSLESRDKGYEFFVMKIPELTPGPIFSNQMGNGMPFLLVVFLGALAGVIMVMACFNYTNLMIAKSLTRAREIGVRKVVGAGRFQVFGQFVGESVVFALLALLLSYGLFMALKPAFLQLNMAQEFESVLSENYVLYGYFILFAVAVGVVAGLIPAGYLSAFRPVNVLKDGGSKRGVSRQALRKSLIVVQFTLSIGFIILISIIFNQVDYMLAKDYGFNDKDILNVRLQGVPFEKLANEVRSLPGVISVGGVSHRLGTWADRSSDYKQTLESEAFGMRDFVVDENYIDNLGLVFLAGNNFDGGAGASNKNQVILNEKALERFGFTDPISSIGQSIITDDTVLLMVIGVVKNFHFRPMNYEIGPLALRYNHDDLGFVSMRILPERKAELMATVETIWKKIDPVHAFDAKMMNEEIDEAYTQSGFIDVLKIVGYISFLAAMLACLGMLGMAMYATQTRLKEIGVRKVMGAGSWDVVFLLSKGFLILILIAGCIGTPIGYWVGSLFLSSYAYQAPISIVILFSGMAIMTLLGALSIGSQTLTASRRNPVESLRYE